MLRDRLRVLLGCALTAGALTGAAACVDLFHSTDFDTLCTLDAAACVTDSAADSDALDAGDAAAAPRDFCTFSRAEARAAAEHACGYLGACLGTAEGSSFGDCMLRALAAYDCKFNPSLRPRGTNEALWQCLTSVSSCSETARCVFGTDAPPCPGGTGALSFTSCNQAGTVRVECGDPTTALGMDLCAVRGQSCAKADVSLSFCAGSQGTTCTSSTPHCEGTNLVLCRSSGGIDLDDGLDCAAFGDGRCVSNGALGCAPVATSPSCTGPTTAACEGASAVACVDSQRVVANCDWLGMACDREVGESFLPASHCVGADAGACAAGPDTCSGTRLVSCYKGHTFDVDCASISGLDTCTKATDRPATCVKE